MIRDSDWMGVERCGEGVLQRRGNSLIGGMIIVTIFCTRSSCLRELCRLRILISHGEA